MRLWNRRDLVAGLAAGGALKCAPLALAAGPRDARLVVVILRGALDGLAAVPPYGDPDYAPLRGPLTLAPPGGSADAVLRLDATFGLHPRLGFLHEAFAEQQLLVLHAAASPYRERSHFDGQSVLENGTTRAHALPSGWLNRALAALPPGPGAAAERGVALGASVPLMLRGPVDVASWSDAGGATLDEDTLQRLGELYSSDPLLSRRLADALAMEAMAGNGAAEISAVASGSRAAGRYARLVQTAARLLGRDDGPRVAVFDTSGWDTHLNEGGAQGQLATRLAALDEGLRALQSGLGPAWRSTAVLLVTEFGRTAAANGTRGTDHGTATVALLLGGAVRGGRVIADWPGLGARALYQGRDVAPTLDLRALFKGVLSEHWDLSARTLDDQVFPDSKAVRPLRDLIRT